MMQKISKVTNRVGFTLIELLVVIGVLAVIAAGVVALIDPVDKIAQANDAKVQNDVGQLATAQLSYAAQNNGTMIGGAMTLLQTSGELTVLPAAPTGYTAYTSVGVAPAGCTNNCTSVYVYGQVKAKKHTGTGNVCAASPATCSWKWESSTGKICVVAAPGTACP